MRFRCSVIFLTVAENSAHLGKTVAVVIIVATFTSILFGIPFSIWAGNAMGSQVEPYLMILPGLVASAFAARFYFKQVAQKEWNAAREKSTCLRC